MAGNSHAAELRSPVSPSTFPAPGHIFVSEMIYSSSTFALFPEVNNFRTLCGRYGNRDIRRSVCLITLSYMAEMSNKIFFTIKI